MITMKISVIFTGGTIGCMAKEGWLSTDESANYMLIDKYIEKTGDKNTVFETCSPCSMLSENLSACELNSIIDCVNNSLMSDCDGIVVTHGTDTLIYTATALSYVFANADKPIMLVSSNYPLDHKDANGLDNFIASVEYIASKTNNGVYISYKNENSQKVDIHIPGRVVLHQEASGDVYSLGGKPFASCENGDIVGDNNDVNSTVMNCFTHFCDDPPILTVESRPCDGFDYSLDGIKAVIIKPYHSGTLNTANKKFVDFCADATVRNIPIFVINVPNGIAYDSSMAFVDLGVISLPMCTYISAFVKCWLAISRGDDIKKLMAENIFGEYSL